MARFATCAAWFEVKYLLGGFLLWLALKGRFSNYAALATSKAG
jgi:hypothetical protein